MPTLLISGKYDEATPKQLEAAQAAFPNPEWVFLEKSAHITNYEEPEKYLKTVKDFLNSSSKSQ